MIALSVMRIRSGHTSVQHLVMLHIPRPSAGLQQLAPVVRVERVHLELGVADEQPRAGELVLVLLVIADHVADVLAEEALDAPVELLDPIDVGLLHPVGAVGVLRPRA